MDGFQWILLFVGLLVIGGVYIYSRRENRESDEETEIPERREPTLTETEAVAATEATEEDTAEPDSEPAEPETPQKIVTLRLVAPDGGSFRGDELILSLRGIGMRHGNFGIYHRYDGIDETRTVFSAASLVEPGSFDVANIKEQRIPGISLFAVLPGPIDGVEAFDMMMEAAHTLATGLKAELLDESGSTLSIQRERYMREEVIQYQTSNLVA